MSDEQEGRPELRPARPDAAEAEGRPSYMPRVPWRWIVLGTALIGGMFVTYYSRQERLSESLRQGMLTLHEEQLSEVAARYIRFRERIEGMIAEAAQQGEPDTWVDPRLNITGLRQGVGLYVRLPAEAARNRESIGPAARGAQPDAIMRCLGISAMNLRGLYEKGEFLMPEWIDAVREEEDPMRLRVLEDQLGRHVQVDVPVLATMMHADWLMVVVQQGENRSEHPVDVFLWDLQRDQPLLRSRVKARGLLVPVRLGFDGAASGGGGGGAVMRSGGAQDCSIASQLRGLAGRPGVEFESGAAILEQQARAEEEAGDEVEPSADVLGGEAAQ